MDNRNIHKIIVQIDSSMNPTELTKTRHVSYEVRTKKNEIKGEIDIFKNRSFEVAKV